MGQQREEQPGGGRCATYDITVTPAVTTKTNAKINAICFIIVDRLFCAQRCQDQQGSLTAITFWSFLEQQSQPNASSTPEKEKGHQFGGLYRTVIPRPVLGLTP